MAKIKAAGRYRGLESGLERLINIKKSFDDAKRQFQIRKEVQTQADRAAMERTMVSKGYPVVPAGEATVGEALLRGQGGGVARGTVAGPPGSTYQDGVIYDAQGRQIGEYAPGQEPQRKVVSPESKRGELTTLPGYQLGELQTGAGLLGSADVPAGAKVKIKGDAADVTYTTPGGPKADWDAYQDARGKAHTEAKQTGGIPGETDYDKTFKNSLKEQFEQYQAFKELKGDKKVQLLNKAVKAEKSGQWKSFIRFFAKTFKQGLIKGVVDTGVELGKGITGKKGQSAQTGQIIQRGGRSWVVIGHDKDGEPLVEPYRG